MNNWYEIVRADEPLTQGDFIFGCPVPTWKDGEMDFQGQDDTEALKASLDFISADVIVLTQACDLAHSKVKNITLCPHLPLSEYKVLWESEMRGRDQNPKDTAWKKQCEVLNSGYIWNQTVLNRSDSKEFPLDFRVVDFYDVYTIPRVFLESLLKKRNTPRLRLLPPYREHLSQAFARFYMRVGLPTDIRSSDLHS